MGKLLLLFVLNTIAYTLLYIVYAVAAKQMSSRVVYVAGVVVGTLIGSTLGERFFR